MDDCISANSGTKDGTHREGGGAFSRRLVGPGLHTRWETGYELGFNCGRGRGILKTPGGSRIAHQVGDWLGTGFQLWKGAGHSQDAWWVQDCTPGGRLVRNWVSTVEGGGAFSRRLVGPGLHTRWETGYELGFNCGRGRGILKTPGGSRIAHQVGDWV